MGWNIDFLIDLVQKAYEQANLTPYWIQEESSVRSALIAISEHTEKIDPMRFSPSIVLGVGGSGIVIRLQDTKFPKIDKALKFPRPIPGKVKLVADLLNKEIQYLAQIQHPRVIMVLDYFCLDNVAEYSILPFYLMDCIDGAKSKDYVKTFPINIIKLIEEISGIIKYLHEFPDGGLHILISNLTILLSPPMVEL